MMKQNGGGNEQYKALCKKPEQLSFQELQERLKHISVCCTSLSIDLTNQIELINQLQEENTQLKMLLRRTQTKERK